MLIVGAAAVGRGHADQRGEPIDEALRIGELRPTGIPPLRDKGFDLLA